MVRGQVPAQVSGQALASGLVLEWVSGQESERAPGQALEPEPEPELEWATVRVRVTVSVSVLEVEPSPAQSWPVVQGSVPQRRTARR